MVAAVSTDLSAAFDTIDHLILLAKLKYYGFSGLELKLMTSYLKNRQQYTDINFKKSETIRCLPCGVVQGSKLSGILYTIYTNEVPILHKILQNHNVCRIIPVNPPKDDIEEHKVVNFVDDSNSVISGTEHTELENYMNTYFQLLEIYYNSKKLKINTDKTQLLICGMPRLLNKHKHIKINTAPNLPDVKPIEQIKLLGYLFNARGDAIL